MRHRFLAVPAVLLSHDLAVVARLADRVLVMRDGVVLENGGTATLLSAPDHPYTKELLTAVPSAATRGRRLAEVGHIRPAEPVGEPVIEARGLRKRYGKQTVVADVDLTVRRGEIVGLVGESGSGKTSVAQLLFGLVAPTSGTVTFEGAPWSGVPERRRRSRRRRLQLISQDPLSSFDPRWTVRRIVAEALPRGVPVEPLLDRVGLGPDVLDRHPRQLSGGQRQRVAIARALAPRPILIICDEPVSALDVSVQAQVLDLLADIRATDGTALLFISHDLGVVHHLADRVLVMKDGAVVESGPVDEVFHQPSHDYTRALLDAVPTLETPVGRNR
ncbi:ATP-binding cassette domain-containing protein [Actinoplanes sp. NPDC026619]|uniref:ATP-binding cassette domain-containing protein n=1 Tax=Actinoplanes sp. NPDC026619 TaxID=3155798 RepID=UPI0033E8727C